MIWAVLAALGVPLWLCAAAILIVTLSLVDGDAIELAARAEHKDQLLGPFVPADDLAVSAAPA